MFYAFHPISWPFRTEKRLRKKIAHDSYTGQIWVSGTGFFGESRSGAWPEESLLPALTRSRIDSISLCQIANACLALWNEGSLRTINAWVVFFCPLD